MPLMTKELQLWQFVASRLEKDESVMLLVVGESAGSSPGRAGYKMAIAADGELIGSIGGGVMEVSLVEQSHKMLDAEIPGRRDAETSKLSLQVHRKNTQNSSGMICSGKQTVIFRLLSPNDAGTVSAIIDALEKPTPTFLIITTTRFNFQLKAHTPNDADFCLEKLGEGDFTYSERIGPKNELYIIGGGHCALALSELMSRMDFRISIFDDRPSLNTLAKNTFADQIRIIDSYSEIAKFIPSGANIYVVVMTLGFKSDEIVIRSLIDKDLKYFGVLGSKAKMKTLLTTLEKDGFSTERLLQIHTPIGLPINSRTPDEIAISIAAQIISIKNS